RDLARAGIEQAGDDRNQGRLAATRRADQQRHLPGVHLHVDPPQGPGHRIAGAEAPGDTPTAHRPGPRPGWRRGVGGQHQFDGWHEHVPSFLGVKYPRKTSAGSSTSTRRMLIKLASSTIRTTAAPEPTITCQDRCRPARWVMWLVDAKKPAV